MKKVLLLLFLINITGITKAQFQVERLTFGGGLGLQFGDYTAVSVSPQVGYNFSKYFNAGVGLAYSHYSQKYDNKQWKQTSNYLGFNVYGKIYPLPYVVLMVQPEANRMWRTNEYRLTGEKFKKEKFIPVCLVGGGLRLGSVTAMIEYDVVQDKNSPYGNDIFYSLGYTFSF